MISDQAEAFKWQHCECRGKYVLGRAAGNHRSRILYNVALTCNAWSEVANYLLYRHVMINTEESLILFVRSLSSKSKR